MWLYWYKDSEIGKNIQEVIKQLDIKSTYGYFDKQYPCGVYSMQSKHLYGMDGSRESNYLLVTTRSQMYKAHLLSSLDLSETEIKAIIGDTYVD